MFKKLWKWIKSLFKEDPVRPEPSIPYYSFRYEVGGFNGAKAEQVAGAEISGLSVSRSGCKLTYKWLQGGCELLGAANRTDAGSTVCCLFCLDSHGTWRGGKFDWISTSRTSRSLENCHNYNGWNYGMVRDAKRFAFVIVSKDGKKRTNVAFCD